ncbi:MAG: hypothetical protein ACJAWC_002368 [Yoonia sp.]|jgi:hypothetical protein
MVLTAVCRIARSSAFGTPPKASRNARCSERFTVYVNVLNGGFSILARAADSIEVEKFASV